MNKKQHDVVDNPVLRLFMTKKQIEELIQVYNLKNNRTPDYNGQEE